MPSAAVNATLWVVVYNKTGDPARNTINAIGTQQIAIANVQRAESVRQSSTAFRAMSIAQKPFLMNGIRRDSNLHANVKFHMRFEKPETHDVAAGGRGLLSQHDDWRHRSV